MGFAGALLTLYWQKWLVVQGGVSMNPSMCRQVFVDERASNTAQLVHQIGELLW